jgi:hypothetical protein
MMLYSVTSPTFVAGLIVSDDGAIIKTAPILKRYLYADFKWFRITECPKRGWKCSSVHEVRPNIAAQISRERALGLAPRDEQTMPSAPP